MAGTPEITIRPYRADDQPHLLELIRELQGFERQYEPLLKPEADIGLDYIADLVAQAKAHGGGIVIAEKAGEPVGYAAVFTHVPSDDDDEIEYTYALVRDLAVTAGTRGQGLGRRLLEACEAIAVEAGAERLRIMVLSENTQARRLYGAFGFADKLTTMEKPLE